MNPKIVTRFPPSPTGYLHIGGVRTALFNYLFAAHHGGMMYLRFEDTDRERSKKEFEDDILEALRWFGIPYTMPDIGRQSERMEIYKKHFKTLVEKNLAYEAEEAKDDPAKKVVRFKNPNIKISFEDLVRGTVEFDTTELGDFVIARGMDEPLYHLAVVIDDHEMGVTHVIRGEEHISNTPRQILILEALGFKRPIYAHIPLILAPDRTKLSKRHGAVSANEYRAQGYLPEALLNYLALLGWNPGNDRELYTLPELTREFSIERVHKSGAIFDIEKLKWFNHEYIKKLSDAEFAERLKAFDGTEADPRLVPLLRERSQTLKEASDVLAAGEYDFLNDSFSFNDKELLLKGAKADADAVKQNLQKVAGLLGTISDADFTAEQVKNSIFEFATAQGRASVLWPLRVALSGKEKSPDPFTLCALLGKEKTLERIAGVLRML